MAEEIGGGARQTTNNQMELLAVIRALEHLRSVRGPTEVISDSLYVLRGITQWIWGWRKRGWKTAEGADVANRELWQELSAQVAARREAGDPPIRWSHVRGHAGIPGNERVDEIAVAYSQGRPPSPALYRGPLLKYFVAIHDLPEERGIPESDPNSRREKPAPAMAYLSLVDGMPAAEAAVLPSQAIIDELGIPLSAMRVKCAVLGLGTLKVALHRGAGTPLPEEWGVDDEMVWG